LRRFICVDRLPPPLLHLMLALRALLLLVLLSLLRLRLPRPLSLQFWR
jgi:hypothetical protein